MVISQGKKADFKPFVKIAKDVFDFRWGKEDINGTSLCNYELHRFFGSIPTPNMLTRYFNMGQRVPSMAEMKIIGEALGMSENEMVPWMKEQLKRAINKYDKKRGADGVENFTINGINVWLEKDERVGLLLRFQAEKAEGKTETTLWRNGIAFPLVIDNGIQMLYALEVYASATYDLKEQLLAEADKLDSVAGMIAFDETRKKNYPAQLAF